MYKSIIHQLNKTQRSKNTIRLNIINQSIKSFLTISKISRISPMAFSNTSRRGIIQTQMKNYSNYNFDRISGYGYEDKGGPLGIKNSFMRKNIGALSNFIKDNSNEMTEGDFFDAMSVVIYKS